MKHLFLNGTLNHKNSAFWAELLERHPSWRLGGYRTVSRWDENGIRHVHLIPADEKKPCFTAENEVGTCDHGSNAQGIAERFDRIGVPLLQKADCDLILMDEIGFMEKNAEAFQKAILSNLDGRIPVIGIIKPPEVLTTPLIQAVYARNDTEIFAFSEENKEEKLNWADHILCSQIRQ